MYKQSIADPDAFWGELATKNLDWFSPYTTVRQGGFEKGNIAWFVNGKINVCWNCVDRHVAAGKGDQVQFWRGWGGGKPQQQHL